MKQICNDLVGETSALTAIVSDLTEEQWRLPTVAEGWDTHETVFHLGAADRFALLSIVDEPAFLAERVRMEAGEVSLHGLVPASVRDFSGADLWEWFGAQRAEMISAFRSLGPRDRLAWIGPEIGARSMATGRLTESWAHSHDIADTFGVPYPRTDRLRNVAHLTIVAHDFSYVNNGLTPPADPLRVELTSPAGELWAWGPESALSIVRADAYEFCKVVTRRVPVAESSVVTEGPHALEWMEFAQPWIEPPTISDVA